MNNLKVCNSTTLVPGLKQQSIGGFCDEQSLEKLIKSVSTRKIVWIGIWLTCTENIRNLVEGKCIVWSPESLTPFLGVKDLRRCFKFFFSKYFFASESRLAFSRAVK